MHQDNATDVLLAARGLCLSSRIAARTRTIVEGVDIEVRLGETVGIVGESGSGKSLTARAMMNLLPPGVHARGEVVYAGQNLLSLPGRRLAKLRGRDIALIFQDPFTMLNPLRSCGNHIVETLRDERGHRLRGAARRQEAARRLAEVGIHDPAVAQRYPFQLSGGMRQRVGIAAALAGDPKVMIADEPSTALDVTTQKQVLALLKSLQESRGMGLILITHNLRVAFSICDRIYVLYAGSVLENGPADEIEAEPLHPYTLALLMSEPPIDRRLQQLTSIPGSVPAPDEVANVCPFSPRCLWASAECTDVRPSLRPIEAERMTACIRLPAIRPAMRETRAALDALAPKISSTVSRLESPVLRVSNLRKVFAVGSGKQSRVVTALAGVSIEVGPSESVGIVGESGSGKSTLARCVVGLETPTAGEIVIGELGAANYRRLTPVDLKHLRRTVQIIFQDPYSSLNPMLTVGATLEEALRYAGGVSSRITVAVSELLGSVGLPAEYAHRKPSALSGGERQRVAIARALAVQPQLLVCDEPVSALDVSVQAQILNLFKELRATHGMAYLFITHDLAVVRQIAERAYVIHRGSVVEEGPVDGLLDNPQHEYTASLIDSILRPKSAWLEAAPSPARSANREPS